MGYIQKRILLALRKNRWFKNNLDQANTGVRRLKHQKAYPNFFDLQKRDSTAFIYRPGKGYYFFFYDRSTDAQEDYEYVIYEHNKEKESDEIWGYYNTWSMRQVIKK